MPVDAQRFALLIGLSLFFGFAFEGFYSDEMPRRPGGVRTFPLLALAGGGLFLLEPHYGSAFIAGLLVLGSWIYAYVRRETKAEKPPEGLFIVPACNVLAYLLGPIAMTQPLWLGVTVAVTAVLLLGGRRRLHDLARQVSGGEIVTAAQFLILVGIVLPLLKGAPPIPYTSVTPFGVWLAVVAVSSISYASYLLQRFVFPGGTTLFMSILGGLYSSTATTVVLARRAHEEGMTRELQSGVIAATAMMYLRLLVICSLFNLTLGRMLIAPLLALAFVSAIVAVVLARTGKRSASTMDPQNPLQISAALIFAAESPRPLRHLRAGRRRRRHRHRPLRVESRAGRGGERRARDGGVGDHRRELVEQLAEGRLHRRLLAAPRKFDPRRRAGTHRGARPRARVSRAALTRCPSR
jgi:uncharacterized membrane protein (DUF4010 family)